MVTSHCTSSYSQEHVDALRLIRSHAIGPATFYQLLSKYGSATHAVKQVPLITARGGSAAPALAPEKDILDELTALTRYGAHIITITDTTYPPILRMLDYPPPVLTVYGNLCLLNQPAVAIVGTRDASANGYRFAYHIAQALSSDFIVVSGLARGIDTAAHQGALKNGTTIAVTACGIDQIYPPENQTLYQDIRERGIIITEMPFGTPPRSQNFPKRNRIIAGLSLGTVVIEAHLKSGSLITAQYALDQQKDVFAVPGSPLDARCRGTNHLLKEGAHCVTEVQDITDILNRSSFYPTSANNSSPSPPLCPAMPLSPTIPPSVEDHARVFQALSASPTDINDIISQTDLTASHILTILLELELAGTIKRYPGNKIALHYEVTSR